MFGDTPFLLLFCTHSVQTARKNGWGWGAFWGVGSAGLNPFAGGVDILGMKRQYLARPTLRRLAMAGGAIGMLMATACTGGDATDDTATPSTIAFAVTEPLTEPTVFVEETPSWFACDDNNYFVQGLSATDIAATADLEPTAVERDEIVGNGPSCIVGNRLVVILNRGEGVTYEDSKALNAEGATELVIGGHPAFHRAQSLQIGHPDGLLQFVLTGSDTDLLPAVAEKIVANIDG